MLYGNLPLPTNYNSISSFILTKYYYCNLVKINEETAKYHTHNYSNQGHTRKKGLYKLFYNIRSRKPWLSCVLNILVQQQIAQSISMQITCVCVCFCHGLTAFDLLVLAVRAVLDKVAQAAAINARLIRAAKLERRAFFALPHRCNERKKTPPPRQYCCQRRTRTCAQSWLRNNISQFTSL
jgi:hypothetical protein